MVGRDFANLDNYIKPIQSIPEITTIVKALGIMEEEDFEITMVTGTAHVNRSRPIRIITIKDFEETIKAG